MEAQGWQTLWQVVFYGSSVLFYGTVLIVAFKGFGDVVEMVRNMLASRRDSD